MRIVRILMVAVMAVFVPSQLVSADLRTPWWSYSEDTYLYENEDCLTVNDCVRTRATNLLWGSAAYNMHHMATHGARFTVNIADLNEHMSATDRYWTNLPAPYFDRDMYGVKCIEAEVTSESSSFPTYGSYYFANFWFTRWYWVGGSLGWAWDQATGTMDYSEQISKQYWWTSDKWDTASPDWNPGSIAFMQPRYHSYDAKSRPSTDPSSSDDPCQFDGGPLLLAASAQRGAVGHEQRTLPPGLEKVASEINVAAGDAEGEVWTSLNGKGELKTWAARNNGLSRALAAHGETIATVTFSRPIDFATLADVSSLGIVVHRFEAVSEPRESDGSRLSFGDKYVESAADAMYGLAAEEGVTMLGVTAAEVTVPDAAAMSRLIDLGYVFVVDATGEYMVRSQPSINDVNVDDVYWEVAGWTDG